MKKTGYIVCICVLSILIFNQMKVNNEKQTSSPVYEPTARFLATVQEENKKEKKEDEEKKVEKEKEEEKEKEKEEGEEEEEEDEEPGKKVAYLTFDDGPSQNTETILKILEEENAVATFFLIGNQITPGREKTVKKALKQGNAIGVHTYSHKKEELYKDAITFFEDFDKTANVIKDVTGEYPILHRFPWGSNNGYVSPFVDELHQGLQKRGIRSYDWNVSGEDALGISVTQESIYDNIKKDLTRFRQPIILLHDAPSTEKTAKVLKKIITYIRSCGYEFDTLREREEYLFPASWR